MSGVPGGPEEALARATADLVASATLFRTVVDTLDEGVVVLGAHGEVRSANRAAARLLDLDLGELLALDPEVELEVADVDDERGRSIGLPALAISVVRGGERAGRVVAVRRRGGTGRWISTTVRRLPTSLDGDDLGWVVSFRDVTELKAAEANLNQLARYDQLTGLPNRRLCLERLASAAARVRRSGAPDLAVLFLDLDRFKAVNDALGHGAGDDLLVAVADRLRRAIRPGDVLARFGGDEFVLVAEPIDGVAGAEALAERVRAAVHPPVQLGGSTVQVTVSTGIALAGPGDSAEALLARADTALYRAKQLGRDRAELFDDGMRERGHRRRRLEDDLRRALAGGGLEVVYQPELHLASGRVALVEALVRWGHPELGALDPQEFVALAEDTGLIGRLGDTVLEAALDACAGWHAAGHDLRVAVNLSARQLGDPGLAEGVLQALAAAGVQPAWIVLEVTETALLEPGPAALAALRRLREAGCGVALDDFGTGSSSLAALRELPVDLVKLDKRFLGGVPADPAAAAVVRAVVDLAHALGMAVVAEGVEDEAQLAALRQLGCDYVQGFLVGEPSPAGDVPALLAADRP